MEQQASQNKLAARECLVAADKFIKDSQFVEAKKEIEKAKKLDPTNLYISAFIDRINYFEKERNPVPKKPIPTPKAPQPNVPTATPKATQPTVPSPITAPPNPVTVKQPQAPAVPQVKKEPTPVVVQQLPQQPKPEPITDVVSAEHSFDPEPTKEQPPAPVVKKPSIEPVYPQTQITEPAPVSSPSIRDQRVEPSITQSQLEEMKRKIDILTNALEEEKKAREDMNRQHIQQSIAQFRSKLEKAWVDGAPPQDKLIEFEQLATSLEIPENVVRTVQREVKIEMYGRAVKEVISKRQLLRSSSSTLEWLRKVYKISMEEYLEYESKFLMDLVADQYKGTILQISADDETKKNVTPRLKSMGYAVVTSPSPEDALEKIDKLNPNVILCESNFGSGSISGIRFLHILRTNSKFGLIPFIFLCNEEDFSLLTSSELRPNEGFVKKPTNIDELSSLINTKLLWFREYIMSLSK
ncbi:MAG: hypothetical protein AB1728_03605 [Bacteroidota bacterium]